MNDGRPQLETGTAPRGKGQKDTPTQKLRTELVQMEGQFQMALPPHITVDRFTRNLMTAVQEEPKLLECDRRSLFQAAMTAAQLGLLVGAALGQAYIIPFNVEKPVGKEKKKVLTATLIPGYRGFIALARNSGEIESLAAYEVCENDEFDYQLGLEPRLFHRPALGDRGRIHQGDRPVVQLHRTARPTRREHPFLPRRPGRGGP